MKNLVRAVLGAALAVATLPGCLDIDWSPDQSDGTGTTQEEQEDALGEDCTASLELAGNFAPGAPQPIDVTGCWPMGTWTFAATVKENGCAEAPAMLEDEYSFSVTPGATEEDLPVYTYLNDPTSELYSLKVSSGGQGYCQGTLEVWNEDESIRVTLKPDLQTDNITVIGQGDYIVYKDGAL